MNDKPTPTAAGSQMPNKPIDQEAYALNLRKLSDQEIASAILNLRLMLDLHLDEQFAREEEKEEQQGGWSPAIQVQSDRPAN